MRCEYYIYSDNLENLTAPELLKTELQTYCLDLNLVFDVDLSGDDVILDENTIEMYYENHEFNLFDLSKSDYLIVVKRCNDYICDNITQILETLREAHEEERYQTDDFI